MHKEATGLNTFLRRAIGPLLIASILFGSIALPASATPAGDKQAQARQIASQVNALDTKLEIAAEDYNAARDDYAAVTAKIRKNEAKQARLSARQKVVLRHLNTRVNGMYRQGPLGALEVLLGAATFEEFAATWDMLDELNQADASQMAELKSISKDLSNVKKKLREQQAEAKKNADVMQSRKQKIESQLAERKQLLAGVQAQIAEIMRQEELAAERAAAEAAARQAAEAARNQNSGGGSSSSGGSGGSGDYGNPTNAPRSAVVSIARSRLGCPYVWAASGPNYFDCSGLTMWVYARVGVSLSHSARAQISEGQRVSRSNLKPGDLVFFGRGTIHHVGIYIGGGSFIEAPHTGDVVKISSLFYRSDYVGACRP